MAAGSFVQSINCIFTYLVLAFLFAAINAAILANIIFLFYIVNNENDKAVSDTGHTTTPSVANVTGISETTPGPFSAETMQIVQEMKKMMNASVNPCNDFFNYACGGWLLKDDAKNDPNIPSVLSTIVEKTNNQLFSLIEKPVNDSDPFYTVQVKKFFAACNNTERLKERGISPFLDFVKTIGKFPLLDKTWVESDFSLQDVLTKLAKLGFANLFIFIKGSKTEYILFTPQYDSAKDVPNAKRKWTEATLQLLGVDTSDASVKDEIDQMFLLEEQIEKFDKNMTENAWNQYSVDSLRSLKNIAPWIDWLKFVQELTAGYLDPEEEITNSTSVIVEYADYFRYLDTDVLQNFTIRALANYMMNTLLMFTPALDTRFVSLSGYVSSLKELAPSSRRDRCLHEVRNIYKESLSRMYVDTFYDENKSKEIKAMLSELKTAFIKQVNSSNWLSLPTQRKIFNKIEKMEENIGYPNYLKDDKLLNELYKEIPTEEYFEAVPAAAHLIVARFLQRFNSKQANMGYWPRSTLYFSPYYAAGTNKIYVPGASLYPPLFNHFWTTSMKYGVFGSVLGHEIMHAFDMEGYKRNESGDITANYWLDKEISTLKEAAICFINQFNDMTVQGVKVNGNRTVSENMADNQGVRASFKGYRDWIAQQGKEEHEVPGFGLNHNQIFFVSYAQIWCGRLSKKSLESVKNEHAPFEARVLGNLRSSPEFSETFGCEPGSPMNPKEKCLIF